MTSRFSKSKSEDLEKRKAELEYLAQMLALEGQKPDPQDEREYLEIRRELEARKSKPGKSAQ